MGSGCSWRQKGRRVIFQPHEKKSKFAGKTQKSPLIPPWSSLSGFFKGGNLSRRFGKVEETRFRGDGGKWNLPGEKGLGF